MKTLSKIAAIGAVSLALVLGSCNSGNNKNNTTTAKTQVAKVQQPVKDTVLISGMKFIPDTITIHQGDTILFINKDIVTHDVTAYPDSAWQSVPLNSGESWSTVPEKGGPYFCSIHKVMKGDIIIK